MKIFGAIAWLILCGSAAAHADLPAADCGTAGEVFQRYLDALGGAAAIAQAQSLLIEAKETEPHTFHPQSMAHQRFRFEWESQNRILVKRQYLLSTATVIYDGVAWSLYNGRVSHNEDATPELRRKLMALPYNDSPEFQEFRMVADPMLLTRARELYRALEVAPSAPGQCVLQARGTSEWNGERRDYLVFDAKTGLLRSWRIQAGQPGQEKYFEFLFGDYRQAGPVLIPYSVDYDFYQASFRLTKVVVNPTFADADFMARP
jgi:hypothetical protein